MQCTPSVQFHDEGYGFDIFGLDPHAVARASALAGPICDRYFRLDSRGAEQIPEIGPVVSVFCMVSSEPNREARSPTCRR